MIPRWKNTDPDVLAEALAGVRREVDEQDVDDELATEREDRDRAERGQRDQDARAW